MPFLIQFTQGRDEWVERIVGDLSLVGSITLPDGTVVGSGITTSVLPSRKVGSAITQASNAAGGVEDLATITLPANLLKTNGDELVVEASFTLAANANNKATSIVFGSTVVCTRSTTDNNLPRIIRATIIRTGAATQRATGEAHCQGQGSLVLQSAPAETLSGTIALVARVQGVAASDITFNYMTARYYPVA